MACNDTVLTIDQYWHIETKGLDASGDLFYLARAVFTRVLGIWTELGNPPCDNSEGGAKGAHEGFPFFGTGDFLGLLGNGED